MQALDKVQSAYLVKTIIPCAQNLVGAIKANKGLLQPLLDEGVIDSDKSADAIVKILDLIPAQMTKLLGENKYVINDSLDPTIGALASTSTENGPQVVNVQLRSKFLLADDMETVVRRARTLIHEICHTLEMNKEFPILDYCYFGGWATSHLGPLCLVNADTFAEAAITAAEAPGFDGGDAKVTPSKWLFRKLTNVGAQHAVLREAGAFGLDAALAWADLRINRGWLRTGIYKDFAEAKDDGNFRSLLEMRAIEAQLVRWNVVTVRPEKSRLNILWNGPGLELDENSKALAGNLHKSLKQVKEWITGIQIRIVKAGCPVEFVDGAPPKVMHILKIHVDALAWDTAKLGASVIDALFVKLTGPLALLKNFTPAQLLDLCISEDKVPEKTGLAVTWKDLLAVKPTPPKEPNALDAWLCLAIVEVCANTWKNIGTLLVMPSHSKLLRGAEDFATDYEMSAKYFKSLNDVLATLPKADPVAVKLKGRRDAAWHTLNLGITLIVEQAKVVQAEDKAKLKAWNEFADKAGAVKFAD